MKPDHSCYEIGENAMSKQAMQNQITARWAQMGLPFVIGQSTDLSVYNEFVDATWRTGNKKIVYEASVYFDDAAQTVFMWEKTTETGGGISGGYDSGTSFQSGKSLYRKIKSFQYGPDGRAYEYEIDLGAIQKIVKETAGLYGWKFKIVLSKGKAAYPAGYQAAASVYQPAAIAAATPPAMQPAAFCPNCGNRLRPGSRFCGSCGQPLPSASAASVQQYQPVQQVQPVQQYQPLQSSHRPPKKVKTKKPLLIGLSVIAVLVAGALILTGLGHADDKNDPKSTTKQPTADSQQTGSITPTEDSSVLSKGVNLDDLGNIMNGQYFFDDGDRQFYSSFDQTGAAHIYSINSGSSSATAIFDGFGWSLTVYDGWLYFSGNQGAAIDGTYNLFRIRPDGSEVERLNSDYCFGMSIYQNYLYFIKRIDASAGKYAICRLKLDGSGEETLVPDFAGYCIIFENNLYYAGSDGILYKASPDGSGASAVINGNVRQFIIGNGKLIYADSNGNIYASDINGQNSTLIRAAGSLPLYSLNSSKDIIYYTVLDQSKPVDQYAYAYEIHRIGFDGSNDQLIYSSASYGTYINIVNNQVLTLDYAVDNSTGILTAVAMTMDSNGSGVGALPR